MEFSPQPVNIPLQDLPDSPVKTNADEIALTVKAGQCHLLFWTVTQCASPAETETTHGDLSSVRMREWSAPQAACHTSLCVCLLSSGRLYILDVSGMESKSRQAKLHFADGPDSFFIQKPPS